MKNNPNVTSPLSLGSERLNPCQKSSKNTLAESEFSSRSSPDFIGQTESSVGLF